MLTPRFTMDARHRWPLAGLVLLPIFASAPALSGLFNTDPTLQFIGLGQGLKGGWFSGPMDWYDPSVAYITQPIGHLAASDWLHGTVPWWNLYSGIGMPLAGEMQTSAFFLPFILLLLLPAGWLYLAVLLQIGCALFTYALFIKIGRSRLAAFLGGGLFALSPVFFLCPSAPITPLPFLPLTLLGIEFAADAAVRRRAGGWALITIGTAYAIYGGNPEVGLIDTLLAGLWALHRLAGPAVLRFSVKLAAGFGTALLLGAPLMVPFLDYLKRADVGLHVGLFALVRLAPMSMPLQILPELYGRFGSALAPPAVVGSFWGGFVRVPVWTDLSVLALAMAGVVAGRGALRWLLFGWIALWEARYGGVPAVTAALNLVPGVAMTDATRYSGAALDFAVIALAAMGFDRFSALSRGGRALVALGLAAILGAVLLPNLGLMSGWYAARPRDGVLAAASAGFALAITACVFVAPRGGWRLAAVLLAGPFLMTLVPQFAGMRSGQIDQAPIDFLAAHIGNARMASLGPFTVNFPARYRIASINYSALPAPLNWTDFVAGRLDPSADRNNFSPRGPEGVSALITNLHDWESLGVRYVVTSPDAVLDPGDAAVTPLPAAARNAARMLYPGGPDFSGVTTPLLPFTGVSSVSAVIGTLMGSARGPLVLTICAANVCRSGVVDVGKTADNAAVTFPLQTALQVPKGAEISYRFSLSTGNAVAVWLTPGPRGTEQPIFTFRDNAAGATPLKPVFRDDEAAIFELPAPAALMDAAGCTGVTIVNAQHVRALCPAPASLVRRELFYPGWHATVNGADVPIRDVDGLFQRVALPAGADDVVFWYRPPREPVACGLALLGLAFLVAAHARRRFRFLKSKPSRAIV